MKKFLLPLILTLAIVIPTVQAQAADVPDIRQISSNIQPYEGISVAGLSSYTYKCAGGNASRYAEQFAQMLAKNYSFRMCFSDLYKGDGEWDFIYTGAKRVASISKEATFHVSIQSSDEDGTISVDIASGLSYAGHFLKGY